MRGKRTLKYITDLNFLKEHISNFKNDYKNLLFYLSKHSKKSNDINEENLIYNINTYSYYHGVKGQATLLVLVDNLYSESGFVNSCEFSQVLATQLNDDIFYLYRKNKNTIKIVKNEKSYYELNCNLNILSLFYLFTQFNFDINSIDNIVNCLNYIKQTDINIFSTFFKKLVDFD